MCYLNIFQTKQKIQIRCLWNKEALFNIPELLQMKQRAVVAPAAAALSRLLFSSNKLSQADKGGGGGGVGGGKEREDWECKHMEHVVGVKHSFQLSQFHKHTGWKNTPIRRRRERRTAARPDRSVPALAR